MGLHSPIVPRTDKWENDIEQNVMRVNRRARQSVHLLVSNAGRKWVDVERN